MRFALEFLFAVNPHEGMPAAFLDLQFDALIGNHVTGRLTTYAPPMDGERRASGFMKSAIKEALNFVHGDYRVQMPMKHLHQSVDPSRPSPGALVLHGAHSGYIDEVADSLNPSTVALMLPLSECRSPYQSRCLNKEFGTIELALGGVDLYGNFKLQGTSDRAGIPRRSVFHPLTKFPLFQKHYDEFHRSSGTVEERAARISDPNMARLASTVASPDDVILTPGNIDEQKPRLHRALALLVIIAGRRRGWATEPRELPAAQLELARKELDLDSGASSATSQGLEEALVDAPPTQAPARASTAPGAHVVSATAHRLSE